MSKATEQLGVAIGAVLTAKSECTRNGITAYTDKLAAISDKLDEIRAIIADLEKVED